MLLILHVLNFSFVCGGWTKRGRRYRGIYPWNNVAIVTPRFYYNSGAIIEAGRPEVLCAVSGFLDGPRKHLRLGRKKGTWPWQLTPQHCGGGGRELERRWRWGADQATCRKLLCFPCIVFQGQSQNARMGCLHGNWKCIKLRAEWKASGNAMGSNREMMCCENKVPAVWGTGRETFDTLIGHSGGGGARYMCPIAGGPPGWGHHS